MCLCVCIVLQRVCVPSVPKLSRYSNKCNDKSVNGLVNHCCSDFLKDLATAHSVAGRNTEEKTITQLKELVFELASILASLSQSLSKTLIPSCTGFQYRAKTKTISLCETKSVALVFQSAV